MKGEFMSNRTLFLLMIAALLVAITTVCTAINLDRAHNLFMPTFNQEHRP